MTCKKGGWWLCPEDALAAHREIMQREEREYLYGVDRRAAIDARAGDMAALVTWVKRIIQAA